LSGGMRWGSFGILVGSASHFREAKNGVGGSWLGCFSAVFGLVEGISKNSWQRLKYFRATNLFSCREQTVDLMRDSRGDRFESNHSFPANRRRSGTARSPDGNRPVGGVIEGVARSALPCCGEEYWNGVKLHFHRQGEPTENGLLNHSMASSDKGA
jgi:hypothetical protein